MQNAKCKRDAGTRQRGERRCDIHPGAANNLLFAFCILHFELQRRAHFTASIAVIASLNAMTSTVALPGSSLRLASTAFPFRAKVAVSVMLLSSFSVATSV